MSNFDRSMRKRKTMDNWHETLSIFSFCFKLIMRRIMHDNAYFNGIERKIYNILSCSSFLFHLNLLDKIKSKQKYVISVEKKSSLSKWDLVSIAATVYAICCCFFLFMSHMCDRYLTFISCSNMFIYFLFGF